MANPHIILFIQNLSSQEIIVVDDFLRKVKALFNNIEGESMEYKFFRYIIENKNGTITDADITENIHTNHPSNLKKNTFDKVLEALTLDKYITNQEVFNEYDIITFSLKKKLLFYKVLHRTKNQGKTEALYELLNEIIEKAKEYEIYDVLVEALSAKKYFNGIRSGTNEFEKNDKELQFYNYCYTAVLTANDNYYRLILNSDFIKALSTSKIDQHITVSIKQMEDDFKKTGSQQINYYLQILKIALAERQKNYDKAIEYCSKLLTIIKENKSVYRNERLGLVLANLSQFKTFIGKYSDATKDAKGAQKYYTENSLNYAISKTQEFYTNFYNKKYTEAEKVIRELLNHSTIDTGEFRKSKFIYYQACTFFAEAKYKEALDLLNKSMEIEKDKTGWNVSLRILNIMIFLELNKINEASRSLESLHKYMRRTGKDQEVKARDILIIKVFREMERDGFEFREKNNVIITMLELLSKKDSDVSWEHYSSELIQFHTWLEGKKRK